MLKALTNRKTPSQKRWFNYLRLNTLADKFKICVAVHLEHRDVTILVNKRLAVLEAMSIVTKSIDMEDFMRISGLKSSEVVATLKELAQDGFVSKTKHGFAIAEKGLLALTALRQLPFENAFDFYLGIDQPLGMSARSVKEFHSIVGTVDSNSLEFHLARGDFEGWVRTSVKDDVFANDLSSLREEGLKGEVLRKQILLGLSERFGEDVLFRDWES